MKLLPWRTRYLMLSAINVRKKLQISIHSDSGITRILRHTDTKQQIARSETPCRVCADNVTTSFIACLWVLRKTQTVRMGMENGSIEACVGSQDPSKPKNRTHQGDLRPSLQVPEEVHVRLPKGFRGQRRPYLVPAGHKLRVGFADVALVPGRLVLHRQPAETTKSEPRGGAREREQASGTT